MRLNHSIRVLDSSRVKRSLNQPLSTWSSEGIKYLFSSAAAFALDFSILVTLTRVFHLNIAIAGAISYLAGLVLIYILSVKYVFVFRKFDNSQLEFFWFSLIGVAGLIITEISLGLLVNFSLFSIEVSKFITMGIVFFFNFSCRKALLFSCSK